MVEEKEWGQGTSEVHQLEDAQQLREAHQPDDAVEARAVLALDEEPERERGDEVEHEERGDAQVPPRDEAVVRDEEPVEHVACGGANINHVDRRWTGVVLELGSASPVWKLSTRSNMKIASDT